MATIDESSEIENIVNGFGSGTTSINSNLNNSSQNVDSLNDKEKR